ncbi:MAG: ACT domain-containing protein [Candidatus Peribacteria bacterium]|jgi:hypothetical protein|nr:ACT domain-containing protein [Candidatus Peribacteria bacterium]
MQLHPKLNEGIYCFISLPIGDIPPKEALMTFQEQEGTTIILAEDIARKYGYIYSFRCAWITLATETDLEMIGITSAFSKVLAEQGISCNVVAGVHHDHIFVPFDQKEEAMSLLESL